MIPVVDPFMAGHTVERRPGDFRRDRFGTPRVSDPAGTMTKPKNKKDPGHIKWQTYSRPSNFGKIIEDMYSVTKWSERQEAYGFALTPELADKARVLIDIEDRDSEQWKDEADKIVKAAKLAAKANLSADRGTHTHALTEDDDQDRDVLTRIAEGEELGLSAEVQQSLVACWREMLERDGIEILAVEVPVVNDTYRAAGTTDRIGRLTKPLRFRLVTGEIIELPAGLVVDVDVKTGQRRTRNNGTVMYWQGYAVQVFLYASGVPYDTETDTRGEWEWEIDQRWALIAHLDVSGAIDGKPSCDLILVDLEAGRRAADLCVAAKAWSNEATVFSVAQIVEGADSSPNGRSSTPSTLSSAGAPEPSAPLTVGEEAGAANAGHSPTPPFVWGVNDLLPLTGMPQHALDELEVDRLNDARRQSYGNWGVNGPFESPSRMALVDARNTLTTEPDQGGDLTDDEYAPLWEAMRAQFDTLDAAARTWRSGLVTEAQRRHVPFHVQQVRTERTYHLNKGLIALCLRNDNTVEEWDEILRALLALIVGDVALFPSIHPGHVVGSLTSAEAERFSALVDTWNGPGLAAYIDDDAVFRLRVSA